jgi:hypothetical protein
VSWKVAKGEADETRKFLGSDASSEEILRVTNERWERNSPAPEPVEEERDLETGKEEEVNTRELGMEEEEEILPGLTCGDIHHTYSDVHNKWVCAW